MPGRQRKGEMVAVEGSHLSNLWRAVAKLVSGIYFCCAATQPHCFSPGEPYTLRHAAVQQ
jgi:hypothetical protein